MSKFRSQERLMSPNLMEEILLIETIMHQPKLPKDMPLVPIPSKFTIRMARVEDIPQLIELYQTIFETYPSPLVHTSYIETIFQRETLFAVCVQDDEVVAAASTELHPEYLNSELTDCATHPKVRGQGLMSQILIYLEAELKSRHYLSSYTMARARSFGMNIVFFRLKYEFMGRLVNNCDIFGCYEDMNIWVNKFDARS
jgi:putative beta-lysine N-acetyltransferase